MAAIAPNTESREYGSFFTASKTAYVAEPVDSYYKEPVTWNWVRNLSDAGTKLGERVEFTVFLGSFSGSSDLAFGSLDTVTPQDAEIGTIGWLNPFTKAGAVGISEQKIKANEGKARKYNYLKGQLDQFIRGQHAEINTNLWASTQNALRITSLAVVNSTTTATGTIFNLNRASYSKWQQTYTNLAAEPFTTAGLNGFRTMEHAMRRGPTTGGPDTIFVNDALESIWERLTDSKEWTEMPTKGEGKKPIISNGAVFRKCQMKAEPVDYPEATSARFFDSSCWHYKPFDSKLPGDPKPPYNGEWWAYPVCQAGALWCDSLRFGCGIVSNFLES